MQKFKVIRKSLELISQEDREQIDEFIECNGGTVFHETAFNTIASSTFKTKLTYFLAYKNDILTGICPCHTFEEKLLYLSFSNLASYEIPYGGWVHSLESEYADGLYNSLKIKRNESILFWTDIFHSSGIKNTLKSLETSVIDLKLDKETILDNIISSNTRHNIRRAMKKGVQVVSITDVNLFIELYSELKESKNLKYSELNINFLREIWNTYSPIKKVFILGALVEGRIISAVMCTGNKNVYHAYIAGRISDLPKNIYQNELLWWECILYAQKLKSGYFDLCIMEKERLPQIAKFKMGFSKDLRKVYCISKKSITFIILNKINKIFNN